MHDRTPNLHAASMGTAATLSTDSPLVDDRPVASVTSLHHWAVDAHAGREARGSAKRVFDFVMAATLSLLTLPIVAVLAVISAVVLREWPFFVQQRVGRDGALIPFIKVRSLPSANVGAYALKTNWTADGIPKVMRAMRRLHLDEIPQLWLVVAGHLSLVGPRPKMPDDVEPVPAEYGQARVKVAQGCTCLWQIGPDTDKLPSDTPQYDYWYLVHGGLRLDLWILFWTGLQMVGLGEPKTIDDVPAWARSRGWAHVQRETTTIVDLGKVRVVFPELAIDDIRTAS